MDNLIMFEEILSTVKCKIFPSLIRFLLTLNSKSVELFMEFAESPSILSTGHNQKSFPLFYFSLDSKKILQLETMKAKMLTEMLQTRDREKLN